MNFFFLHCASKPQAVVVITLCMIYCQKESHISCYLYTYLIALNIFGVCYTPMYITVNFGKKRRKETINQEILLDPTLNIFLTIFLNLPRKPLSIY